MTATPCPCPGCVEVSRVREALRVGSQSGAEFEDVLLNKTASPEEFARALESFRLGLGVMKAVLLDTASLEGIPT